MNTLVRMAPQKQLPVQSTDPIDDSIEELANKSAVELGYVRLRASLNNKKEKEKQASIGQTVLAKLASINVFPFESKSLDEYKNNKTVAKNSIIYNKENIIVFCISSLFLSLAIYLIVNFGSINFFPGGIAIFSLLYSVPFTLVGLWKSFSINNTKYFWKPYNIVNFSDPIPEFALQTAIDVKKVFPEATFCIEKLEQIEEVKVIKVEAPRLDPFLVAHIEGKDYYLEVWNEAEFKQNRVA